MKRIFLITLILLLLPQSVCVSANYGGWIIDEAGILTDSQEQLLSAQAQKVSNDLNLEVIILTIDSLNGKSARSYADDYYDTYYAGDGILLLLAMTEREWYISTSGSAIKAYSDYALDGIGEAMLPDLASGYYSDAFEIYLSELVYGYNDTGSELNYANGSGSGIGGKLMISVLIGAAMAGIVILIMRSSMNTRRPQHSAADYLNGNSFDLRIRQDIFLYSQVTKTPRQQSTSQSGGSSHRSSGGISHGGRGGKF